MAVGRLELLLVERLLGCKLPVALVRIIPANIDNALLLVGVRVERLALDRVAFDLVRSHLVLHGRLLLR